MPTITCWPPTSIGLAWYVAGGQPLSMANLRATYELCRRHGILVMLDATRALENAWFIKQREDGYADRSIAEIMREICALSDGATVSSKVMILATAPVAMSTTRVPGSAL